ncbi:MAG: serine--tRNA ligase [archaeon]|nr:serine--tRNA ligase [Candidatus Micrarchaeota archaeon]
MLDIKLIRENPELVRNNLAKRKAPKYLKMLEEFIASDKEWRALLLQLDELRHKRNLVSKEVNEAMKQKEEAASLIEKARFLPKEIKEIEAKAETIKKNSLSLLLKLPNLLDESVPFGGDETKNKEVRRWGKAVKPKFSLKHHGELSVGLNQADFQRAVKVSGSGFFALKNELALMDLALQKFAVDELIKKNFTLIEPPLMIKRKPYEGVTDLEDFEKVMYKIDGEELYLIATSEHPLASMHMDEILTEKELPIKYVGVSPCFRREIGKHGLEERGFFRVHQFNKVEQVIICNPEESQKHFEELLRNAETLTKKLMIPYRVVEVCTGDIGIVASRKADIEAWSPREKKYFEIHSCSNCTSFQARRLNIKYRKKNSIEKEFVHTLNSTAIATSRMLRAIIENHQTKKGTIKVPKVLQKYMNGLKEIKKSK